MSNDVETSLRGPKAYELARRALEAMAVAPDVAGSVVRVSFGPDTSDSDIDRFLGEWRRIKAAAEARAA